MELVREYMENVGQKKRSENQILIEVNIQVLFNSFDFVLKGDGGNCMKGTRHRWECIENSVNLFKSSVENGNFSESIRNLSGKLQIQ